MLARWLAKNRNKRTTNNELTPHPLAFLFFLTFFFTIIPQRRFSFSLLTEQNNNQTREKILKSPFSRV